jgi:hypothetical protein
LKKSEEYLKEALKKSEESLKKTEEYHKECMGLHKSLLVSVELQLSYYRLKAS